MPGKQEDRRRFLARIEPLLAPSEILLVMTAYDVAKLYHRWQTRKELDASGNPVRYFEHKRAVTLIAIDELGCIVTAIICASLLHDTLEDTRYNQYMMESAFGSEVTRMVKRLSKIPKKGYAERLIKYGEWPELLIKTCDIAHNMRTLKHGDIAFQAKQIKEFQKNYNQIPDRLLAIVPVQYHESVKKLQEEICHTIEERNYALKTATKGRVIKKKGGRA